MEQITKSTRATDLEELKDSWKYLLYKSEVNGKAAVELSFEEIHQGQPAWSVEGIIRGTKRLMELAREQQILYDVYAPEDCADDPEKADVKVWYMPAVQPSKGKPFVIVIAGGAYVSVCSMVEAFPTAARFNELGYTAFVLNYRVGHKKLMPKPLDDLAAALKFILDHKDEFKIDNDEYVVNGYSAGANLTALWGTERRGYANYGLPKPKAVFPIYPCISSELQYEGFKDEFLETMFGTSEDIDLIKSYDVPELVTDQYPPTYMVHGKKDLMVPSENAIQLKKLLDVHGIKAQLELPERAPHGFGDGTGTDAAGWPDRAMEFVESL